MAHWVRRRPADGYRPAMPGGKFGKNAVEHLTLGLAKFLGISYVGVSASNIGDDMWF